MTAGIDLRGCRYRPRWARSLPTWDAVVAAGDVAHVIAPNATGKSTFLRAAVGLIPAVWQVRRLATGAPGDLRWLSSDLGVPSGLPVRSFLRLVGERCALEPRALAAACERWGIQHDDRRRGAVLSRGTSRAVALAALLAGEPGAVLLDEPSVALDLDRQDALVAEVQRLQGQGAAIVVASHDRWLQQRLGGQHLAMVAWA